ncbi:MAG: SDR family NAD(P)-dependent oxidoreductase [Erythrobacter sp.]
MTHLLIFGLGYTASRLGDELRERGWRVVATGSAGNLDFADHRAVSAAIDQASHILSSVPPDRKTGAEPVLEHFGDQLAGCWLGYLSSTGVYGDAKGAWVDETAPTGTGRRSARSQADARWMELGARVFRLPGIYGPGRSALDRVQDGRARRIDMSKDGPRQVFSRVHVDDIVSAVIAALEQDAPLGAYNLADDLPASGNRVTEEAARLLGMEPPPLETLEQAGLSEMARGFYSENRRVSNAKAKRVLNWRPKYPTYVEGLQSLR